MKITIEQSPYGDTGAVYEGALGMMQHFRLQLISFRGKSPDTDGLEQDILGYEAVIASGSEKNANAFLEYKRDENHVERCANNFELVEWLKANGHWDTREALAGKGGEG
jgi:hypothetical protein